MSVGEAWLATLSSVTRTQSRCSTTPPAGSQVAVETTASRLSFQIASVGRPSTASAIVAGAPGCLGAGGVVNPVVSDDRFEITIDGTPLPAGDPVIRAYASAPVVVSATASTVGEEAGVWSDGRQEKKSLGKLLGL